MNRTISTRLARIEQAVTPPRRQFIFWDAGSSDPSFDLDAEIARFREEGGVTDRRRKVGFSSYRMDRKSGSSTGGRAWLARARRA
jgi:hypothetical protein